MASQSLLRLTLLLFCLVLLSATAASVANWTPRRHRWLGNEHCRAGLYIHDSDSPVQSGICPPRINCARLLGLPPSEVRCRVEYLGSPRLLHYRQFLDTAKNLFRFGCAALTDCQEAAQESGELSSSSSSSGCYRAIDAMHRRRFVAYPLRTSVSSVEDAALLCP